jgi:large subunit ribosomal protein L18
MDKTKKKILARIARHKRVRKKISGTSERPRLSVFKSAKHIYVQAIDDVNGKTLAEASTLSTKLESDFSGTDKASAIGESIAKKLNEIGVTRAVFDKGGFVFHGRVKAVADSARSNGLTI